MIIGACGFSLSGSSAITDFLMEFEENQVYLPEFIFAYHPDGLCDLDYHLNEECAKFLSSGVAIPRFRKVANMLLSRATHGKVKNLTDDYLDSLIQARWIGGEQGQRLLHCRLYNFMESVVRAYVTKHIPYHFAVKYKVWPLAEMTLSIRPDNFSELTQKYTDDILSAMGFDVTKNIVLDQPFPGNDPRKSMRYYRDAKAIIVDRDPRDTYALMEKVYPTQLYSVPHSSVEVFADYYYHMHKDLEEVKQDKNILYIHFEELVYDYENTTQKVVEFLGLGKHSYPKKYFEPEKSIVNSQVFRKYPDLKEDCDYLEQRLKKFCFDYDAYPSIDLDNKNFFNQHPNVGK